MIRSRLDQICTALVELKGLGVTPSALRMSRTTHRELQFDPMISPHVWEPPREFKELLGIPIEIEKPSAAEGRLLSPDGEEIDENEPRTIGDGFFPKA